MADDKKPVSFDDIIQADRARRRNEQLASEIFSRNRGGKETSNQDSRSSSRTPSLASRMGVAKTQRSSSSSSFSAQRPSNSRSSSSRTERIASALSSPNASNIANPFNTTAAKVGRASGFSIKGKAGPFTVLASNFAPGTTAADIESALSSESLDSEGGSGLLSCRLTSTHPTVVAEIMFSERSIAERVIKTYDKQRADGRVLNLSLKSSTAPKPQSHPQTTPPQLDAPLTSDPARASDDIEMAVDETPSQETPAKPSSRYDSDREAAAATRDRRDRERDPGRRAELEAKDGRYGFDESVDKDEDRNGSTRRDEERERDRDHDRDRRDERRDERREERRDDRDRRDDRERDRERRYDDRDRDRGYERREERDRGSYGGRGGAGGGFYGNGMGGFNGPRGGGYGGFRGRGGMYNSGPGMRGGYRGYRG